MTRRALGIAITLAVAASTRQASAQPLPGMAGAACTARSDCRSAFRCVSNVCVDEATFHADESHREGKDDGTIGYVGMSFGVSLPAIWNNAGEAFQLSPRLGMIVDKQFQLQIEASPATTVFTNITSSAFSMFDVVASIGYLVALNDFTTWVVRIGGGGGAVLGTTTFDPNTQSETPQPIPFGELRLDFFGVSIRTSKHLLVECDVPSFRLLFLQSPSFGTNVLMMWVTSVTLNYVF